VSDQRCPSEAELFRFVDADLSPEQLQRIETHLQTCSACAKQVAALRTLIEDVAAPLLPAKFDTAEHVAGVMARLDEPKKPVQSSRFALWSGVLAAAAALALAVGLSSEQDASLGEFAARGAPAEASLSRDVGIQLYTYADKQALRPLEAGSRIRAGAPLTAGLRNLGSERAYLLLFAVDSQQAVHWIAPEFLTLGSDPQAVLIAPSQSEQLLQTAAIFDDLAPGPLGVIAILTREPLHVSQIESLSAHERSAESLSKRFGRAEVRQFTLNVTP
jgi:hypothetical protein